MYNNYLRRRLKFPELTEEDTDDVTWAAVLRKPAGKPGKFGEELCSSVDSRCGSEHEAIDRFEEALGATLLAIC